MFTEKYLTQFGRLVGFCGAFGALTMLFILPLAPQIAISGFIVCGWMIGFGLATWLVYEISNYFRDHSIQDIAFIKAEYAAIKAVSASSTLTIANTLEADLTSGTVPAPPKEVTTAAAAIYSREEYEQGNDYYEVNPNAVMVNPSPS